MHVTAVRLAGMHVMVRALDLEQLVCYTWLAGMHVMVRALDLKQLVHFTTPLACRGAIGGVYP
jgi:hypothetical protein